MYAALSFAYTLAVLENQFGTTSGRWFETGFNPVPNVAVHCVHA